MKTRGRSLSSRSLTRVATRERAFIVGGTRSVSKPPDVPSRFTVYAARFDDAVVFLVSSYLGDDTQRVTLVSLR